MCLQGLRVIGTVRPDRASYDGRHDILGRLARQAEEGALTLRVARTYPMEQAHQATAPAA